MAIISFRHQFIFIKTQKTAGTSLEVHFAPKCGDEDIVTPIRNPSTIGHRPRNYEFNGHTFNNHMTAADIRRALPDTFATAFKFCFERHPVEKCLSYYGMLRNSPVHKDKQAPMTWEQYLEVGPFPVDTAKYTDGHGTVIVDRIFRYEELDQALAEIEDRLGMRFGPLTAQEKTGFRDGVPTLDQITNEQRHRIETIFSGSLRHVPY